MKTKFCVSYSCGKDSTLALSRMISAGNEPAALIVTVNKDASRSWFHGVDSKILSRVSESLGIPLIEAVCDDKSYEEAFVAALEKAKKMGAEACVFGDIDIEGHKIWGTEKCSRLGMEAVYPLWQENRLGITNTFIQSGFKAYIKAVSKQFGMSRYFLGKTLTADVVKQIQRLGLDPCGENGEYHTFCYDGPIFKRPVTTKTVGIYESKYAYSLHVELE